MTAQLLHLKHNNACGLATRNTMKEAYLAALLATQLRLLVEFYCK
jgi:AICAR transformylase/IMP cyclohydrolase PurH